MSSCCHQLLGWVLVLSFSGQPTENKHQSQATTTANFSSSASPERVWRGNPSRAYLGLPGLEKGLGNIAGSDPRSPMGGGLG